MHACTVQLHVAFGQKQLGMFRSLGKLQGLATSEVLLTQAHPATKDVAGSMLSMVRYQGTCAKRYVNKSKQPSVPYRQVEDWI